MEHDVITLGHVSVHRICISFPSLSLAFLRVDCLLGWTDPTKIFSEHASAGWEQESIDITIMHLCLADLCHAVYVQQE